MRIRQRLRSALWRVPVEHEVREELAHHAELRTQELIDRGVEPARARDDAMRRFGDLRQMEARLADLGTRRNRGFARREWWNEFLQDVRFAFRQARRQPGFTTAAILTLALGIGATTAIFSVVHAVVLRPLPFAEPDRIVLAFTAWRAGLGGMAVGNFDYIRQRTTTLDHVAGLQYWSFNLSEGATPERILGARTTWNYFAIFGVPTLHGRTYTKDEDAPGRGHVVVLSHRFWQRRFSGDPAIVGRQIRMNGEPFDVIGIMPETFDELSTTNDVYVPIAFTPERLAMHDEHYLEVYGLRKRDATLVQINDDLSRVAAALRADFPRDAGDTFAFEARQMHDFVVEDYRLRLFVLFSAVTLVLVIACVNVANLLIARLAARSRELAIRAAIGAGRGRIVRQVLTESLVLAVLGGSTGVLLAWWGLPVLVANAPDGIPRLATASLDRTVVAAAIGLVLASAVLVGLLPAWQATRKLDLRGDLGDGKGAGAASLRPWVRQTLIAGQAALVLIVLAGAALLVRSAINLQQTAIGFDPSGVLSARVALPAAQYRGPEQVKVAFRELLDRVSASPLLEAAALDSQPPLIGGGGGTNGLIPEGRAVRIESVIQSRSHFVSPEYFKVLRIPMRSGRAFTPQDLRSAPLVMIISESLAKEAFGIENPIGRRIACCEGGQEPVWKTVIGVVADVRARGPAEPPRPAFYLPVTQIPDVAWTWVQNTMNVIMRSRSGDPAPLAAVVRDAVRAIDPSLPVYRVMTMEEGLRQTMAEARFNTSLMTLLGLTGLVLAALGIYSVVAWLVAQRTREIGVRMALGASSRAVLRDVTVHGLKPVAIGLAIGLAGALAAGKLFETQLFNVGARDPIALGSVVGLMLIVAVVAAIVPAWRASSIDPSRALHDG